MDLAEERNVFNTTSLICFLAIQPIQTDEVFMVNGSKHTRTYTHTHNDNERRLTRYQQIQEF